MELETAAPPTSTAATSQTEPDILAGIASGEGQTDTFAIDSTPAFDSRPLLLFGAVAAGGVLAALLSGFGRRA